jgi:hypothetical protein
LVAVAGTPRFSVALDVSRRVAASSVNANDGSAGAVGVLPAPGLAVVANRREAAVAARAVRGTATAAVRFVAVVELLAEAGGRALPVLCRDFVAGFEAVDDEAAAVLPVSAHAVPVPEAKAAPIPSATAKPPTRPI